MCFSGQVARFRWVFLPLGLCALAAVGAHAAADVVGDQLLWLADRVDAFFDAIFSSWSVTAPLVDLIGLTQRTFFARALALTWELSADALLAVPLLNYQERAAEQELALARVQLRKRPSLRLIRPVAALLVGIAGARAVARMVQGTLLHLPFLSALLGAAALFLLLAFLVPRAVFRSLEHAALRRRGLLDLVILGPLALAAVLSL